MKKHTNKSCPPRSACPINYAVELLGDKWSLLIIRDCLIANKSAYSEFLQSPEGISTNILADRLKKLELNGLLEKLSDPENAKKQYYLLTDKSISLANTITELIDWGSENNNNTRKPDKIIKPIKKDRAAFSKDLQRRYRAHAKKIKKQLLA